MTIRHSLLAILTQGSCYGYQLRTEFERRTGSTWPLNVGQVYNTLDRLVRDHLVTTATHEHSDAVAANTGRARPTQPQTFYQITDAGRAIALAWLAAPLERYDQSRDELALKIAIAMTLPGVEVEDIIATQQRSTLSTLNSAKLTAASRQQATNAAQFAQHLIADNLQAHAEAELRWLDQVTRSVQQAHDRGQEFAFDLTSTPPKRGRPAASTT
ncbi:MAG: PadR family transcriptional regulator [Rhodoglobus sp.]